MSHVEAVAPTDGGLPPAVPRPPREKFRSTVVLAIFGTILFLPTGILAAIELRRAARARAEGDVRRLRTHLFRGRVWALTSLGFAAALVIVGFGVLIVTANNHAVWTVFFDPKVIADNFGPLLAGFWVNVKLFLVAEVAILVWSVVVAVVRDLPGRPAAPLRFLAIVYIDVFRGLPTMLILLVIGLGLPRTGLPVVSGLSNFESALLALTLNYGAYMAETVRAGMHSVHPGQESAARSLGLSHLQTLRRVILPQAIRNMIPPLLNGFIMLQKDTALVSVIGVVDALSQAQTSANYTASLAPYAGVAMFYLVITIPSGRLSDYLIARNRAKTLGKV
ncbi:amino acid ABC transporter permease [Streptomyces arenae]|uniref:amino acid ABC transporter permease n=1 Tax=Streptomyces arenae TaxID=29301 RepID=UPI00265B4B51|nr:amino acid ABC transporter permease [Streptomyces arenae]MCG7207442.1 amino acid ABC transporter permease [Streptomyces arenae]